MNERNINTKIVSNAASSHLTESYLTLVSQVLRQTPGKNSLLGIRQMAKEKCLRKPKAATENDFGVPACRPLLDLTLLGFLSSDGYTFDYRQEEQKNWALLRVFEPFGWISRF